jgi:hypothetical protein
MLTPNGSLLEPALWTTITVVIGSSHLKNQPERFVCPSKDSNEQVEYDGRMLEGTFDTLVLSILIKWFDDEMVSTTIKIRIAARTLRIRANLTIKLDPLLLDFFPVNTC